MSDRECEYEIVRPKHTKTTFAPEEVSTLYRQLRADIIKACIDITTSYCVGKRSKSSALLALQTAIPRSKVDEGTYNFTLSVYTRILDDIESHKARAEVQGRSSLTDPGEQIGGPSRETDERRGQSSEPSNTLESMSRSKGKQRRQGTPLPTSDDVAPRPLKRPRSVSIESDDEGFSRPRIDVKSLPWVIQDEVDPTHLLESLRKTISILENVARDPKLAKSTLVNSAQCPQFPDSEWSNILAGRAVDLDRVLASIYSVSHEEKRTEKFGNIELTFGASKPAKTVDTLGKWVIAWEHTINATLYTFPHRSSELHDYGKHLNELFAAFPESYHTRIIQYDRAVRLRTAQRRNLLLTDYLKFSDLHVLWIQSIGLGAVQDKPKPVFRRRDPCRRWNEGKCPNTSASCNYGHVCSRCRSNAHVATECQSPRK